MLDDFKKNATLIRVLLILLVVAVGVHVFGIVWQILTIFSDILIILISAWLMSFVIEPIVDAITTLTRLSKMWATTLTYLLLLFLLVSTVVLFIPVVTEQIKILTVLIPDYLKTAPPFVEKYAASITNSLNQSVALIPSVAQFLLSIFVVLILSFYLTVDKEAGNKEIMDLTPDAWHEKIRFVQKVINNSFASFLRVQLIFGVILGITTWVVFTILGIEFAASTSLLSGVFATIPLIGPLLSIIPAVFVAFLADQTKAVIVFVVLLIMQQIIFNIVGPRLLGKAFSIHPGIVILSFLVGTKVAGGAGALFAVPVLGIATVIFRQLSKEFLHHTRK